MSCWQHYASNPHQFIVSSSKRHWSNQACCLPTPGLLCNPLFEASIHYSAIEMLLKMHGNASYLSVTKGSSRADGHIYLGKPHPHWPTHPKQWCHPHHPGIIKHVMSSTAKAEISGLFINAKESETLRTTLDEMGYPQEAHQFKLSIQPPAAALPMTPSTNNAHDPSTWDFVLSLESSPTALLQLFLGPWQNQSSRLLCQAQPTQTSPTTPISIPPTSQVNSNTPD